MSAEVYAPPKYSPALTALIEAYEFVLYEHGQPYPLRVALLESALIYLSGWEDVKNWEVCGTEELECSDGVRIVPDSSVVGLLWGEAMRFEGCPMRRAEEVEIG